MLLRLAQLRQNVHAASPLGRLLMPRPLHRLVENRAPRVFVRSQSLQLAHSLPRTAFVILIVIIAFERRPK